MTRPDEELDDRDEQVLLKIKHFGKVVKVLGPKSPIQKLLSAVTP